MEVIHEEVRPLSGLIFKKIYDPGGLISEPGQIVYMIYLNREINRDDIAGLQRFLRLFYFTYKIVLVEVKGCSRVGFAVYISEKDKDEMAETFKWIADTHKDWEVCEYPKKDLKVVGERIANNRFHAGKIMLQGERLD